MLKIHFVKNKRTKQFTWKAIGRNGKSIAIGGETYTSIAMAKKGFTALENALGNGAYKVIEEDK